MAVTDYDTPRTSSVELPTESLDLLRERRAVPVPDIDEMAAEEYELPGSDIADDDLTAPVIPMRADEFRCGSCFLVLHQSLQAGSRSLGSVCRDCA